MNKTKPTKAAAMAVVEGTEMTVPINNVVPSRFQKRTFDKDEKAKLQSLADDIKKNGLLQKPMVIKGKKSGTFELIFGERRQRAYALLGNKELPVILVDWSEERIRNAHYSENAKRADLHPLDQAATFLEWKQSTVPEMTTRELALQVGMSERETAKALALVDLIEPAQKLFREGKIYIGHAHQLARLSPEVQPLALDQCFEQKHLRWNAKLQCHEYAPIYDEPRSVTQLVKWINDNVLRDLSRVPWKLDDATLLPSQGPCSTCQFNTKANALLFGDVAPKETLCTNAEGFTRKMHAYIDRLIDQTNEKESQMPLMVSTLWSFHNLGKTYEQWFAELSKKVGSSVLTTEGYHKAGGRDKCQYERTAIYVDGKEPGTTIKVCIEDRCPSHSGRRVSSSTSRGKSSGEKTPAERDKFNQRKQELFDIKVNEKSRKTVMLAVVAKMNDKIDRIWRERIAAEFFLRCPDFDQRTIEEIMRGLIIDVEGDTSVVDNLPTVHYDFDKLVGRLKKFSDRQLGQFLHLCSFAHYGANQYMQSAVNQHQVIALAKERGVDYKLADAKARVELSSKKFLQRHLDHLEAVQAGRKSPLPHVYDAEGHSEASKGSPASQKAVSAKKTAKRKASKK